MQARLFDPDQPLPELLRGDLAALLSSEGDGSVTWTRRDEEPAERSFTLRAFRSEESVSLRAEFWIPEWMNARGVAAILPAHLVVADCEPGRYAVVELGTLPESEWAEQLPRLARTCARLLNELWGRTEALDVGTVEG